MSISVDQLCTELSHRYESELREVLDGASQCALVDFPNHPNVGDSSIWLGEIQALGRLGVKIVYTCDKRNYSRGELSKRLGHGPILIHGGGNFGDLWPDHQKLREEIISSFPNNTVIQLPQTVCFRNRSNAQRAADVMSAHSQLTVMVRDQKSLEFVNDQFSVQTVLCPDAAFNMGPMKPRTAARVPVLALLRTDLESDDQSGLEHRDILLTDWRRPHQDMPFVDLAGRIKWRLAQRASRTNSTAATMKARLIAFEWLASRRTQRGLDLLSTGQVILTDRLHGHILGLLLSIPNVLVGDKYGKVEAFRSTWTAEQDLVHWASSASAGVQLAKELVPVQTTLNTL